MRKLLALILTSASFLLFAPDVVTKVSAATNVTNPQIRVQIGRNRRWRNRHYRNYGRTVVQTRYVQRGWNTYRETYQIRYLPNGMVQTNLISRVRVS
ncbi:MAG TPA: hypothetical protein VGQ39_08160 [Pyrinomonadaceae bacterium]|nr:hypothetical protein [Pyrinomonadaceae bacterium]